MTTEQAQRRTSLSSKQLNGRFNQFKGNEVLEALEAQDERLRNDVMSALLASGMLNGKVKAADFKKLYIAHSVFGENGVGALNSVINIAIGKGYGETEGVHFLKHVCTLPAWCDAVDKSAEVKNFEMLLSKLELENFATDDFNAGFPTFAPVESPAEEAQIDKAALLTALDALNAAKIGEYGENRNIAALLKSMQGAIEAGEVKDLDQLTKNYVYAFEKLVISSLGLQETLKNHLKTLVDGIPATHGELPENSHAEKALNSIGSRCTMEIENATIATVEDLEAEFTKAVEGNRWLASAKAKHAVKAQKSAASETPAEKTEEEIAQAQAEAKEAVDFVSERFKPEDRIALIKDMPLNHFLMFSDYTSNRDAQKRAQSAKAPTLKNKKGVLPHLVGSLVAPQQKLVKILYITKETCPQLWGAVEAHCEKHKLPCTLPYIIGDAHSRKYAWQIVDESGVKGWKLERPEAVDVMVFSQGVNGDPLTDDDVFSFVGAECSKFTAFSNTEINEISLIESKLEAKSAFVKNQWQDAITIYAPGADLKDIRSKFNSELMLIDALNVKAPKPDEADKATRARLCAGIKAAILETADMCRTAKKPFSVAAKGFWADFFAIFKDGDDAQDVQGKETGELVDWIEDTNHKNRKTGKLIESWSGSFNDAVFIEAVYQFGEWLKRQK